MPVMDGIALALAVARDFPNLKILLMTVSPDQRERASGLNAIVHDVVTKPFSVHDIRTAVADALAAGDSLAKIVGWQSERAHHLDNRKKGGHGANAPLPTV
jgi:DNA-binding NarL/FixJ family response regulator